jgi:Short C-terminal domain/Phospholipase_D-nuclease N-terminal
MSLFEVMASIFWFMLLVAWFWLMVVVITDLFRDRELSGWAKALWCIFVIVLPWLGVLMYLIVRGRSMNERALQQSQENDQAFRRYVRDAAGAGPSMADELAKLAKLRDDGAISPEEYESAKNRILVRGGPATVTDGRPPQPSAGAA